VYECVSVFLLNGWMDGWTSSDGSLLLSRELVWDFFFGLDVNTKHS